MFSLTLTSPSSRHMLRSVTTKPRISTHNRFERRCCYCDRGSARHNMSDCRSLTSCRVVMRGCEIAEVTTFVVQCRMGSLRGAMGTIKFMWDHLSFKKSTQSTFLASECPKCCQGQSPRRCIPFLRVLVTKAGSTSAKPPCSIWPSQFALIKIAFVQYFISKKECF